MTTTMRVINKATSASLPGAVVVTLEHKNGPTLGVEVVCTMMSEGAAANLKLGSDISFVSEGEVALGTSGSSKPGPQGDPNVGSGQGGPADQQVSQGTKPEKGKK
jgi:hypothetical protein